jgi:hypothetical protein
MKKRLLATSAIVGIIANHAFSLEPLILFKAYDTGVVSINKSAITVDFFEPLDSLAISNASGRMRFIRNGREITISKFDQLRSAEWIHNNSQINKIIIKNGELYYDNKIITMEQIEVIKIWEAFPWKGGLFCYGRLHKDRHMTYKNFLLIPMEEIEPFYAIWIDLKTRKGIWCYMFGKWKRELIVYPLPRFNPAE